MSWIDQWRLRRQNKRKLKEMAATASVFATLRKLEDGGMIHWDAKLRRMFIEQPLAVLMMTDADHWFHFIQNLYLYTYYNQCQQAWTDYLLREELAAVRSESEKVRKSEGKKGGVQTLSRYDVERIRRQRRDEIVQSDMPAPKVDGFEFFLVQTTPASSRSASPLGSPRTQEGNPAGHLIAVGYYDPDTDGIEMAPWDEIAPLIKQKE